MAPYACCANTKCVNRGCNNSTPCLPWQAALQLSRRDLDRPARTLCCSCSLWSMWRLEKWDSVELVALCHIWSAKCRPTHSNKVGLILFQCMIHSGFCFAVSHLSKRNHRNIGIVGPSTAVFAGIGSDGIPVCAPTVFVTTSMIKTVILLYYIDLYCIYIYIVISICLLWHEGHFLTGKKCNPQLHGRAPGEGTENQGVLIWHQWI